MESIVQLTASLQTAGASGGEDEVEHFPFNIGRSYLLVVGISYSVFAGRYFDKRDTMNWHAKNQ